MFSDFIQSAPVAHITLDDVHLWLIDTRDIYKKSDIDNLFSLLSDEEKLRIKQFRKAEKQHQFLVSRAVLRCLLNALLKMPSPRDLTFTLNAYGKPALAVNSEKLQFNLSHSGTTVLIAITSGRACGVDIESIDRTRQVHDLAKFYFHPTEFNTLKHTSDELADVMRFYKLWTLKEAFIKAEGKGMAIPGDGFYFDDIESVNPQVIVTEPSVASEQTWLFSHYFCSNAYSTALAIEKIKDRPVNISRRRLVL